MDSKNIFLAESVHIFPPNGGLLIGAVKEGEIRVGMQTDVNGKTAEITVLQVGDDVKDRAIKGEKCGFLFVCKDIVQDEIKEGKEINFSEPKE